MEHSSDKNTRMRHSMEMRDGICSFEERRSITVRRQPRLIVTTPNNATSPRMMPQNKPSSTPEGMATLGNSSPRTQTHNITNNTFLNHEYREILGHHRSDYDEQWAYATVSSPMRQRATEKPCYVDDVTTNLDVVTIEAPRSNTQFKMVSTGEAGSAMEMNNDKPDYCRHKYDSMIDPNLPQPEKKKLRRILANRASARRSRERKKEAMDQLLHRERELIRERDAAMAKLSEQMRISADLQEQVHQLKRQLTMYQKDRRQGANQGALRNDYSIPSPPFATDTEPVIDECFTWYTKTEKAIDSMDPYAFADWNPKSGF